jgi:VanZ family protein
MISPSLTGNPLSMTNANVQTLARLLAWSLAAAIVVMTLGPVGLRPQFGHASLERFAAYMALGGVFSIGYPRHRIWVALAVVFTALGLEIGQLLVPGRDARVSDALVKTIGAVCGVFLVTAAAAARDAAVDDART